MKSTTSWLKNATALEIPSELMEFVLDAQEPPNMMLSLNYVSANQDSATSMELVFLDVESTKSWTTEFAAARQDSIQSEEFVENAAGMRFMIKASVSAEFHAIKTEFTVFPKENASAFLTFSKT